MTSVLAAAFTNSTPTAPNPGGAATPAAPDAASPFDALLNAAGTAAAAPTPGPATGPASTNRPIYFDPAAPAGPLTSPASSKPTDPASNAPASAPAGTPPTDQGAGNTNSAPATTSPETGAAASAAATNAAPESSDTSESGETIAAAVHSLLDALQQAGFTSATGTAEDAGAAATTGPAPDLLRKLASALEKLEKAERDGKSPSKDLLKQVRDAVAALSGYLAALQPQVASVAPGSSASAAGAADGSVTGLSGISSLLDALNGVAASPPGAGAPAANDESQGAATAAGTAPTGGEPLVELADKVEALASALAPTQPGLAGDLDHLAEQLQPRAGLGSTASQSATAAEPSSAQAVPRPGLAQPAVSDGAAAAASTAAPPPPSATTTTATVAATPSQGAPQDAAPAGRPIPEPASPAPVTAAGGTRLDRLAMGKAAPPSKSGSAAEAHSGDSADKPVSAKITDGDARSGSAADFTAPAPSNPTGSAANAAAGIIVPTTHDAIALANPQASAGAGGAVAQQAQAAYQAVDTAAVNLPQMAFEIARHADRGANEFQIRLDPADLGRVNVTLAVGPTGAVNAHLSVERPETLALLQRDASSLNQALTQAGLDGSKTNLQFSLSQNPFTRQDNTPQGGAAAPAPSAPPDSGQTVALTAPAITHYRGRATSSGLNIFV